uniref:Protein RER1 n=10 Tax=Carnivora TaxID=33554 RepID=A0ABI7Z3E1_FELCA
MALLIYEQLPPASEPRVQGQARTLPAPLRARDPSHSRGVPPSQARDTGASPGLSAGTLASPSRRARRPGPGLQPLPSRGGLGGSRRGRLELGLPWPAAAILPLGVSLATSKALFHWLVGQPLGDSNLWTGVVQARSTPPPPQDANTHAQHSAFPPLTSLPPRGPPANGLGARAGSGNGWRLSAPPRRPSWRLRRRCRTGQSGSARLSLPGPCEAPARPPARVLLPAALGDRARPQGAARYRMSEGDSVGDSVHGKPSVVYRFFTRLGQIYQSWLDKSTPYTAVRWVVTLGLSFVYMIRVYLLQGWYIVTYALGIYHLNLFIAFLSPKVDPSLMEDSDDGPSLPTKQNEEFRPFIRRLPEFKFWHAATKGILVAMACTFFEAFNVPVFWPILVMYFIMLFCITMKRQIKHMIKYRYIPFTHGKRTYKGKEDAGKTFAS